MHKRWKGLAALLTAGALIVAPLVSAGAVADDAVPDTAVVAEETVAVEAVEAVEPAAEVVEEVVAEEPVAELPAEVVAEPEPVAAEPVVEPQGGNHEPNEGVCTGTHLSPTADGDLTSETYTAPEGFLISGYCVKAGSIKQGNGPEYVTVNPPAASITFSHSSGKDISHFSVTLVEVPDEEPTITSLNPPVVKDKCGVDDDHYGLPVGSAGVSYTRDGLDIIATLAEGYAVSLVPEGWTADGEGVYRFAFDGSLFTDEACPPEVFPVPAQFSAEPEPPTCDTAGSFDFDALDGDYPNVTVDISPEPAGPGTYVITVTPNPGYVLEFDIADVDKWDVDPVTGAATRTIVVLEPIGFQSEDSEAPCFLAPPLETTLGQPTFEDACGTANDFAFTPEDTDSVDYEWASDNPADFDIVATVADGYNVTGDTAGWVDTGDGVWTYDWAPAFTDEACDGSNPPPGGSDEEPPAKGDTPGGLAVTGLGTDYRPWALGAFAGILAGLSLMFGRKALRH